MPEPDLLAFTDDPLGAGLPRVRRPWRRLDRGGADRMDAPITGVAAPHTIMGEITVCGFYLCRVEDPAIMRRWCTAGVDQ